MCSIVNWMVNLHRHGPAWLPRFLGGTLLLSLAPAACTQSPCTRAKPLPLAKLEASFARQTDAARAMETAEAIKCRRLRLRLEAAGAVPRRLRIVDRAVALPSFHTHEAALTMYVSGDRLRLFWATRGGVRELPAVPMKILERRIIMARDRLEHGDPQGNKLWGELQALHRMLLGSVRGLGRRTTRLLVLPHGMARFVPVHALVSRRDATGAPVFVSRDVTVSYAPCLALASRRPWRPAAPTMVIPAYGSPARPLPGSEAEVSAIARLMPRARRLEGAAATPAALQQALTARAPVHFSGHGLVSLAAGKLPELVFGGGRSVNVRSAGGLKVEAPLVVLSSCTTAHAARFRDGKRLMTRISLAEALLAAGARQVVAASWLAKDRFTAGQMEAFYTLLNQHGPAEALARAQRRSVKRLKPPNPRFWATHALYGGW